MISKPVRDTCSSCGKIRTLAVKSRKLCQTCNLAEKKKKKQEKKEFIKKKKATSITTLIKKLDRVFSIYIRLRYAKSNGEVKCFTCDKKMQWRSSQCGHFMSRRYMSTRFHEHNCMVQCYACNIMMAGNQYVYGLRLDMFLGEGTAESMLRLSKEQKKFIAADLQEMIEHYEAEVDRLRHKLGLWD